MTSSRLPRIAFLSHSAAPSGAELFVLRVTAAATRIDPLVVLGEDGPLVGLLTEAGVEVVVLPIGEAVGSHGSGNRGGAPRKALAALAAAGRLARFIRSARVDVVTTHSAKAHVYGGLAGRLARVPVVAHVHDRVGANGSRADAAVMRLALGSLPTAIVANSATTRATLGRSGRGAAVVPCPAAIGAVGHHDGPFTLAIVGRLCNWKGQDVALRAFADATARGLAPDARLRIVGAALFDGDRPYADGLRQLVTELGLEARVEFRGHRTDIAHELGAVDAVVHASRRPEPFGQVVVEAMAAGRGVIASAEGGPAEIVDHGRTGFLVRPDDTTALADAMLAMQDPQVRQPLADAARVAARRYALDVVTEQLEDELLRHA